MTSDVANGVSLLQARERLAVGKRFLSLRPGIVLAGATANAACVVMAEAPPMQRTAVMVTVGSAVTLFFLEAAWLRRRALTERWLFMSLAMTLVALATATLFTGGLASPLAMLMFAPVVIGLAAFRERRDRMILAGGAIVAFALVLAVAPLEAFPRLASPWFERAWFASALTALALLGVGVMGLVDAHANLSVALDRMRLDALREVEARAASVDRLGARVAHEVKNPLTAVRGLVQLVARNASDEKDSERLGVVVAEVDRALEVLRSYLTLSRPFSALVVEDIDVRALLADVAGVVEARALANHVTLELDVGRDAEKGVGDRQRLKEAILNLALNAIRAMPNGGVLRLEARRDTERERLELVVADTGQGMSEEMLARLGRRAVSDAEDGTGLGVLIAQSIARQHDGALDFTSSPQRGTRATISLPSVLPRNGAA